MMKQLLQGRVAFLLAVFAIVAAVYGFWFGNGLVFDDARLTDGTIFGAYGSLAELKPRLLSYGSFVWLGDGHWPVQRAINLLLHLGTALGLWFLVRGLMAATDWRREDADPPDVGSLDMAAAAGVALFAANPVAVYGVGYLIQRSVVMAGLFSAWALVAVLAAARGRGWGYLLVAVALYLAALLSKEHAVMLPVPAMALYCIVRRPPTRVVVGSLVAGAVLVGALGALLASHYSGVVGQVFDARSRLMLQQLDALRPGVEAHALGLSMLDQAWLFFRYGLLWLLPNVMWMSADLRPSFPLDFTDFPQMLGGPLYLLLLLGSVVLMVRHRDWRQYLGFALFAPAALFATEFATVWVQDPFVLYRSYLWALGMPFLFALPFIGARPQTTMIVAGVLVLLFAGLSFERLRTFRSDATLWADVAAKHDPKAGPAAVGRGRAYMWRGNDMFVRGMFTNALLDYDQALRVGEHRGQVQYHRAAALKMLGQNDAALQALAASAQAGGDPDNPAAVDFLKAQTLRDLGRHDEAGEAARAALAEGLGGEERILALSISARGYVRRREHQAAVSGFEELLALAPEHREARVGLALSLSALGRQAEAEKELETLQRQGDGADVHFGFAMLYSRTGRHDKALAEAERALALRPGDPALKGLVARLKGS